MKKKILFIISSGRSGSTLLCKFLGMHSKSFPLSEPQRYDMATETNGFCSCREKILNCQFWESVRGKLDELGYTSGRIETSSTLFYQNKGLFVKFFAYLKLYFFSRGIGGLSSAKYYEQIKRESQLLRIVSEVSGKSCLIDASKSLVRAIILSRLLKRDFDTHFIYLYRNPASVIYSTMKKQMSVQLAGKEITYTKNNLPSLKEATEGWRRGNLSNLRLMKIFGISPTYVNYEEFTAFPKQSFNRIGEKVELNWEDEMLDLSQVGHHMISGNLSRINACKINPPSDEYAKMDEVDQNYIKRTTGRVLARLSRKIS